MTEEKTMHIPAISCGHCVNAIVQELTDLDGIESVDGNPEDKTIRVAYKAPMTLEKIKETLSEMNYPAA